MSVRKTGGRTTEISTEPSTETTTATRHRRSHSQLNDYLHCSWAFRLKRLKKIPERPSVWLSGGKAFHSATEDFDREMWQEDDLSTDETPWVAKFGEHFDQLLDEARAETPVPVENWRTAGRKTKDKPNGEDIAWWHENGPTFVANYIHWRVENNRRLKIACVPEADTVTGEIVETQTPAIEVEMRSAIGGIPMLSFADRVFEDPDTGELLIVDLKTGSRKQESPMQLATYSLQLEPIFKRALVWGAFYDARSGRLQEPVEDLTRFNYDNLGRVFQNLDAAATAGIFLPNIGSHCKACGLRESCIWQGFDEPQTEEVAE